MTTLAELLSGVHPKHHATILAQVGNRVPAHSPTVAKPPRTGNAPPADCAQKRAKSRVVVSIIGLRRRALDDDNFNGGCKALRDCIAASLGIDDGDKRLTWQYGQLQTRGREGYLVRIETNL